MYTESTGKKQNECIQIPKDLKPYVNFGDRDELVTLKKEEVVFQKLNDGLTMVFF